MSGEWGIVDAETRLFSVLLIVHAGFLAVLQGMRQLAGARRVGR